MSNLELIVSLWLEARIENTVLESYPLAESLTVADCVASDVATDLQQNGTLQDLIHEHLEKCEEIIAAAEAEAKTQHDDELENLKDEFMGWLGDPDKPLDVSGWFVTMVHDVWELHEPGDEIESREFNIGPVYKTFRWLPRIVESSAPLRGSITCGRTSEVDWAWQNSHIDDWFYEFIEGVDFDQLVTPD